MRYQALLRTVLTTLLFCVGLCVQAEVTTTTNDAQHTTTVTSTDTTGVVKINKWSPAFEQGWGGGWGATTYKLIVKFDVRAGSKLSFDWGGRNGWYEVVDIALGTTKIVSDTYQGDYGSSYEKMFKKSGTQTLTVTLQRYSYGCDEFFVKNMKIDHDAGQGPDGMLPFHPTSITAEGTFASDVQWYRIQHTNTGKYFFHDKGKVGLTAKCVVDSAYYWTFTGTAKDGIQIYNMQTGPGNPVTIPERVNKGDVMLGGEGDTRFLIDDNGDDYVFFMDGDTVALNATATSNYLQAYKPTTIYKTYRTNSSTKISFSNEGQPRIVPMTTVGYEVYKSVKREDGYYDYVNIPCNDECLELFEGDEVEIDCVAYPDDATDKSLSYSLDKTGILKIEAKEEPTGFYLYATAQKGGECMLSVWATNRPQVKRDLRIKVTGKVRVSSITFDTDTMRVAVGDMRKVNVNVLPEDAYDRSLKWTNSRPNVAAIGSDGSVYGMSAGTTVLTAKANDDSGKSAKLVVVCFEKETNSPLDHDARYLYASHEDGSLTAIPLSYIEQRTLVGQSLSLRLTGGIQHVLTGVASVSDVCPVDLPRFTSYKFNNKFNDQLFTDAIADEAALLSDTIILPVACIGKRLTASFQMDADTLARAWVGTVRQHSKETRQRFDHPITYTIGHKNWKALQLVQDAKGHTQVETIPFGQHVTVVVDWLAEHSDAPYTVPRIDITFGNGSGWNSSQWIGRMGKDTYVDATVKMYGYGVFPDLEETAIQIKGRGNSSWSGTYSSKNPYHFKFEEKQKPLGMKSGKHWLLLANKQNNSMTTNAIAHRAAALLGMASPCHIMPVELYINGSYRGSYNLTERVALANNSVDLEDDGNAAIIELDTYTDERIINEYNYYLPVKLKDPDDDGNIHQAAVNAFQTLTDAVSRGQNYGHLVDLDKLASFLITNELILNCEVKHPKSVFAYNENIYDADDKTGEDPTPWVFGPLWDCDWAYGYQQSQSYFVSSADLDYFSQMGNSDSYGNRPQQFWSALRTGSQALDKMMYSRLYHFVTMGGLDELLEYCDDYYQFAKLSLEHNKQNATSNTDSGSNYGTLTSNAKSWLAKRAASMFSRYEAFDLSDDEDADHHPTDAILSAQDGSFARGIIYDLQGRRMQGKLLPGIYLRDGKKFLVK